MLDCLDDTDGVINIVVDGGIPDYTFNWSATDGGVIPNGQQNNQNLTGLVAGTYTVDVLDSNNCPETLVFIIEEPSDLTVELDPNNPSTEMLDCYLDADGVINITVEGGTPEYSFTWSATDGGVIPNGQQNNEDLTGLVAGTYTVDIEDGGDCPETLEFTIDQPEGMEIDLDESFTDLLCFENEDGTLNINVTGGTLPYEFTWSATEGGVIPDGQQNNEDLTELAAGIYTVDVSDSNNCPEETLTFTVSEPDLMVIELQESSNTDLLCFEDNNGTLNINIVNGTGTFLYTWSATEGGVIPDGQQNNQNLTGLVAGIYSVLVTDDLNENGIIDEIECNMSEEYTITEPDILSLDDLNIIEISEEELCNNINSGSIELEISGGTPPYTFVWQINDNGPTEYETITTTELETSITDLEPGDYYLYFYDENGCIYNYSETMTIPGISPFQVEYETSNYHCNHGISCAGLNDGWIDVSADGEGSPFTYTLFENSNLVEENNNGLFEDLPAGIYEVLVEDIFTCSYTIPIISLTEPDELIISSINFEPSTYCLDNGTITAEVAGGCTSNYTFSLFQYNEDNELTVISHITQLEDTYEYSSLEPGSYVFFISESNPNDIDEDGIPNDDDPDMDGDGEYDDNNNCIANCNDDDPDVDGDGIVNQNDLYPNAQHPDSYTCAVIENIEIAVASEPNFETFATLDINFDLFPDPENNDYYSVSEYESNSGDCNAIVGILNQDDFGGSGNEDYETYWYIDNGTNIGALDPDDEALLEFNNQFEITVNIENPYQEIIFEFIDFGNGTEECQHTTFIPTPLLTLDIDATSSVDLSSINPDSFSSNLASSAVSCFGAEDAWAEIELSRIEDADTEIESCFDESGNEFYWEVNWFLDTGNDGAQYTLDPTDIPINNNLESNTDNDNILDTYRIQDLAPGFYFAQIKDCAINSCSAIVSFDLRDEPELPLDIEVAITQSSCTPECTLDDDEASACWDLQGGTPPYNIVLQWEDPNNPGNFINVPQPGTDCVTGDDLPWGSYRVSVTDNNDCTSEIEEFDILLVNEIDPSLVEINLNTYPGEYNVSCYGASDGSIENIIAYSLYDVDQDGNVNTLANADIDNDGIINTQDPDIDGDGIVNWLDSDIDGDGFFTNGNCTNNCNNDGSGQAPNNDEMPIGIDTDDIAGTWDPITLSEDFEIDWGIWDPENLSAGEYAITLCRTAFNTDALCPTQVTFELYGPNELYAFVPDYETCEDCYVNVSAEISGGQGPYKDKWEFQGTDGNWNEIETDLNIISDITEYSPETDYDTDDVNGFPYNILLPTGSYRLTIENVDGCSTMEPMVFEVYEAPFSEEVEWANIEVSGCETSNNDNAGGIATIYTTDPLFNDQFLQVSWFTCKGDTITTPESGDLLSENMITGLEEENSYYAQLLYPINNDIDGDGTLNEEDNDIDGDNILNEEDNDIDGDGILNQYDQFPNGNFKTATICFDYSDNVFNIEGDIQNDVCNDNNNENNSITITISSDSEPTEFTFNWFNSDGLEVANTQNLEDVTPGTYTLLTTHNDGCEVWEEFVIDTPDAITIEPSEFNGYSVPCPSNSDDGACEGTVTFDITGGIPFENSYYQYTINNADANVSTELYPVPINSFSNTTGAINVTIDGLCPGNNIIDIIDQVYCVMTIEVFMNEADLFVINNIPEDVSCPTYEDGSIEIEVSGGNPPYSFEWILDNEPYSSEQNIYNLSGGSYDLSVTDDNGCIYSQTIEVYEAPEFDIEIIDSPPICNLATGYVAFDIEGGHSTGDYKYTIESSNSLIDSELIYNYTVMESIALTFGEYEFVFFDSLGCESENIFVDLSALSEDCLQIPSLFSPNGDAQNDVWQIGGIEDYPNAKINVYNRWGQLVFNSNGNYFGNEWDGTHNGTPLPFAVYYYVIDPINENTKTYHGSVTIKR